MSRPSLQRIAAIKDLFSSSESLFARIALLIALLPVLAGCQGLGTRGLLSQNDGLTQKWTVGGESALGKGRLDQAEVFLAKALEHRPDDYRIRASLAETYLQKGELQPAIQQMRSAVELSNDPSIRVQLGTMLLEGGKWMEAHHQMELALQQNRKLPSAWVLKAKTEIAKGDWKQAIYDFQRSLSLDPNQPEIQMQVAQAYMQTGQPLRSLCAVEQILDRHPVDQQPHNAIVAKSEALVAMKQFPQAIEVLQIASQRADAPSDVFIRLSQAQLSAGQASDARTTLARAKVVFPNQPIFDSLVQQLQTKSGDVADARNNAASAGETQLRQF